MICRKCGNNINQDDFLEISDSVRKNGELKQLPDAIVCPACGYKSIYILNL